MARFIDRLLAYGSSPSTVASLTGSGDLGAIEDAVEAAWRERHGSEPLPPEERRALASWGMTHPPEVGPTFDVGELVGVPVFAADDVARYTGTLAQPLEVADEVATLAPPFDRFWIDVDGAPDPTHTGLRSWGWLVESVDPSEVTDEDREEGEAPPKWVLQMRLFVERTKGRGEGPVASHLIGLAEDGTLYRRPDGEAFWAGRLELRDNSATTPEWTAERISGEGAEYWIHLLFPALLTISFLHCTNVSSVVVAPPEKVSAKHRRRHGLPLVRYTTLDIDPFRQLLTAAGGTDGQGLRAALHVTRGHFKVYGTDAPLFGRLTGSWWWAPHLRGQPSRGVVVKDYRIAAPPTVGRAWQDLSTASPARPTVSQPEDPDRWGAGLVRHNETVNMLAESVRGGGLVPLRAALREPAYDLAFVDGERLVVVEVKSLTEANEERQLRLGLGQVLRWRQLLAGDGHDDVLPVLACSRPPTDPSWITATEQLDGVLIVSPTDWTERLSLQPR